MTTQIGGPDVKGTQGAYVQGSPKKVTKSNEQRQLPRDSAEWAYFSLLSKYLKFMLTRFGEEKDHQDGLQLSSK